MSDKRGSINHFLFFFFLIFHWCPYYVMLCKLTTEKTQRSTLKKQRSEPWNLFRKPLVGQIPNGEEVAKAENKKEANKHIRKRG
jgi:hypothetical protein